MTEGFLLQSFFKEQQVFYIPKKLYCEKTLEGDFAGKSEDIDRLIIPSRTNIMDLDRESRNRKALIQLSEGYSPVGNAWVCDNPFHHTSVPW